MTDVMRSNFFCRFTPHVSRSNLHGLLKVQKLCRILRKCFYLSIKLNKHLCVAFMYIEYSNVGNERRS